jgi:Tfp pilus assembly protein PilO
MFRFTMPIILIGVAVTVFMTFTNPLYGKIKELRSGVGVYDEALNNSLSLEKERDKLTTKYNAIGDENLNKLEKLLPSSVDNIRLILEIEQLAKQYNMALKDVRYEATNKAKETPAGAPIQGGIAQNVQKDYGVWSLQFGTQGSYTNFINFIKDIENHLRIVDISSVSFSSNVNPSAPSDTYKYDFTIKTYWLKN